MRSFFTLILSWAKKIFNYIIGKLNPSEPDPEDPIQLNPIPTDIDDPSEIVCYYGCPNSNKAKKLQLGKTLYR